VSDPDQPRRDAVDPADDAVDRAEALSDVGRHEEAELLLRRALAAHADDPGLRAALAQTLFVRGETTEALVHADRTVALAPDVGYGHALRSALLGTDLRRRREAVDAAREAVRLDPEEPFCHRALARACLRSRWFPEALDAAERAVALDPEDADAHALRGAALMGRGRPAEAEAALREALRLDPEDGDTLHDLGLAVSVQGRGRQEEARELFVGAARADPTDQHARRSLASAARRAIYGRWGWIVVGLALLRAGTYLFGDDDVARWPGTVLYLLAAAAVTAFVLLRGRRRRGRLSPAERGVLGDARPSRGPWRPVTLPTRRRRDRR
jgi:tetratricopeptide (TPR) repeat protein